LALPNQEPLPTSVLARLPIGTLPILLRSLSSKMAIGRGAMAISRQEQALREKLVGYVFLASLAAVIALILYNHIVMF
jgi:hypothetical protein